MERYSGLRASDGHSGRGDDKVSSSREPRSSATGGRSALARTVAQHKAFVELARVVAAGQQGIWTGALPLLLSPAGAVWGAVYRVAGNGLEMSASEGLPLSLRPHVEAFDLTKHATFAACRAVRTRRAASEEKVFASVVDARTGAGLEAAGIASATAVPIVHGGAVFGVLLAGAVTREVIDSDSLIFLDAAASLLAPALAIGDTWRPPAVIDRRSASPARMPSSLPREREDVTSSRGGSSLPRGSSKPPRPVSVPPPSGPSVDVGRTAVEAVQQCTPFLRRTGIDMRLSVEEGHIALGESSDVGLAIAHLVTNAAEAAAERSPGALAPSQPRRVRVAVAREGTAILVSVDDSGRGVPPDLRGRVFEAGFSTKGKNRGNGLTLVRKIALSVGGHVEVGSSDLGGASFRLVLAASGARPESGTSGMWHTGATWPNIHASGRETRDAGEAGGGGEGSDGDPATTLLRRASSG